MMPPETATSAPMAGARLDSLYDVLASGGPVMWPIGLCSVIALTYVVERWLRLRPGRLGTDRLGRDVLAAVKEGGPSRGLEICQKTRTSLGAILGAGLRLWNAPFVEREKAVEDAGSREVKSLSANLKPLVVVANLAPLLGLLGTVWGMIQAFSNIALKQALGKPELLAKGIAQALITTVAGLVVAIPTQVAFYWLKGKVDRLARRAEEYYSELTEGLSARGAAHAN